MTQEPPSVRLPQYMMTLGGKEFAFERQRFLIKLAALYASESGSLRQLTSIIGKGSSGFFKYVRYTPDPELLPAELAVLIEKACGREIVPREELSPHIFK